MSEGSTPLKKVVWYKIKLKNRFDLFIFCSGCADLMPFFLTFYFVSSTSNLGPPRGKSLQNGVSVFLLSRRKIEPVTTHKMASHLMHMDVIFQENMCLTDANHYKHSKMTIFDNALTQERIGTFFSGVQPKTWYFRCIVWLTWNKTIIRKKKTMYFTRL